MFLSSSVSPISEDLELNQRSRNFIGNLRHYKVSIVATRNSLALQMCYQSYLTLRLLFARQAKGNLIVSDNAIFQQLARQRPRYQQLPAKGSQQVPA